MTRQMDTDRFDWISEGDEPLPLSENITDDAVGTRDVWLFTCCSCGRRLADPPMPPGGMNCGCGGDYVCHRFDPETYYRLWTESRDWGEEDDDGE